MKLLYKLKRKWNERGELDEKYKIVDLFLMKH